MYSMKDKTLPDNEIVKALECCSSQPQELCCNCPIDIRKIKGGCITALTTYAIDLINRLQAENERLKEIIEYKAICIEACEEAKSKAVKEFAEKVEQRDVSESDFYIMVKKTEFNNLLKEFINK